MTGHYCTKDKNKVGQRTQKQDGTQYTFFNVLCGQPVPCTNGNQSKFDKSWAHKFSGQSHWSNLSWKTRANSSAFLAPIPPNDARSRLSVSDGPVHPHCVLAPSQRSSPRANSSRFQSFHAACSLFPAKLSPTYFHLFPMVSCPSTLHAALPKLFPWFPFRPRSSLILSPSLPTEPSLISMVSFFHAACSLPPSAAPSYISTVSCPSTLHARSLPMELSPSYFRQFPVRRSLPKLFPAHGFLSPSYSYFCPSTLRARSLPTKLSASSLHAHALPKLFPTVSSIGPRCILAPLAPSQRTSVSCPSIMRVSGAISHGSSQRSFPQGISMVSCYFARSLPAKLSRSHFARCPVRPSSRRNKLNENPAS